MASIDFTCKGCQVSHTHSQLEKILVDLSKFLVILTNITLGWKYLPRLNTLAYFWVNAVDDDRKVFERWQQDNLKQIKQSRNHKSAYIKDLKRHPEIYKPVLNIMVIYDNE